MSLFATLQEEVGEWSQENFGDQPDVNPALGVVEEYGELVEHVAETDGVTEHELDCVGDMLVYMADFCARRGLNYQAAFDAENADPIAFDDPLDGVTTAQGYLYRSVLKRRQGIRLDEDRVGDEAEQAAISAWLRHLSAFARERGYTLGECVQVAWYDEVIDREWDSSYT